MIERPFYRYHDLQAGQIVEVRMNCHHFLKSIIDLNSPKKLLKQQMVADFDPFGKKDWYNTQLTELNMETWKKIFLGGFNIFQKIFYSCFILFII